MKKIISFYILILPFSLLAQNSCDILIRNGRIIDGTGNSWYYGDVAVKDGKIIATGRLNNYTASKLLTPADWWWRRGLLMCMVILKAAFFKGLLPTTTFMMA